MDRIDDELYEEMDIWFGELGVALHEMRATGPDLSEDEKAFLLWKEDIKHGMGVVCESPYCALKHFA